MVVLGGCTVSYERGTPVPVDGLVLVQDIRYAGNRRGAHEGVLLESQGESGLDCLACAIFARQVYRATSLVRNRNPP